MFLVGLPHFIQAKTELTFKGRGIVHKDAGPLATTLNYDTVQEGSAPEAGDLVVWVWFFAIEHYDNSPLTDWRRSDLTGSGWAQNNQPAILPPTTQDTDAYLNTALAKVVTPTDISSPPTIQTAGIDAGYGDNFGMWVAYEVSGTIASVSIPSAGRSVTGASSPSSIGVNSSALNEPDVAIAFALATGTDGSIGLSGITLDKQTTQNNLGGYYTNGLDVRAGVKLDVGGGSYTISKGDDGSGNSLFAGYVAVQW